MKTAGTPGLRIQDDITGRPAESLFVTKGGDCVLTDYQIEIIDLQDEKRFREIEAFLAKFDLTFDRTLEYTISVRFDGQLVGTGSFSGEILRNIAVDERLQGTGLTSLIVSELMQEQARQGRMHYFIFTQTSKAHLFASLGFKEIARAEPYAALLESGLSSIETYCDAIAKEASHLPFQRAAVVANCNPFTRGHEALIRKAAAESGSVIVFVVSEDKSLFPFEHRIKLVKAGVADLPNVVVVSAGDYVVSSATFPAYFTREENKVTAQTRLDIMLFATQIARRLGITARYIGEEPYCAVTNAYNEAMLDIFPTQGLAINVMARLRIDGDIISASKVRDMIRHEAWESIKKAVPEVTYQYLISPEARETIDTIRRSNTRH
jgi:[citrate (pro-3S)-lyase] ligase